MAGLKNRQQGIVLPIVLVIMIILSVLGIALIGRMTFDTRVQRFSEDRMQAHYLARSGLEIGRSIGESDAYRNQAFFTYGNLLGSTSDWEFGTSSLPTAAQNYQVAISTEKDETTGRYKMTATGRYNGQKCVLNYTFPILSSSDGTLPSADPPVPADAIPASQTNPQWLAEGNTVLNSSGESTIPVKFTGTALDYKNTGNVVTLKAPQIFFSFNNNNTTLTTMQTLNVYANLTAFYCKLDLDSKNKSSLTLYTYNSTLYGQDIGGSRNVKYGLVYFDSTVLMRGFPFTFTVNNVSKTLGPGYYYFPEGTTVSVSPDSLIPISDPASVNLSKLNIQVSSGEILPGLYN